MIQRFSTLRQPTYRRLSWRARVYQGHSSSRFSRTMESLLWAFNLYILRRTIITFTEVDNDKRFKALTKNPKWGILHDNRPGGHGECAIAYLKSRWQPIWFRTRKVADTSPLFGANTLFSADGLLEHWRTGQSYLVSVLHTAARVQDGTRWRQRKGGGDTDDVKAYKETLIQWPEHLIEYQQDPDIDHIWAGGDLNVDLRMLKWRQLLERAFAKAGLHNMWPDGHPGKGTHGGPRGREIDGGFTDLQVTSAGVYPFDRSSDHAFIWFRALMRRVTKTKVQWKIIVEGRHRRWEALAKAQR